MTDAVVDGHLALLRRLDRRDATRFAKKLDGIAGIAVVIGRAAEVFPRQKAASGGR